MFCHYLLSNISLKQVIWTSSKILAFLRLLRKQYDGPTFPLLFYFLIRQKTCFNLVNQKMWGIKWRDIHWAINNDNEFSSGYSKINLKGVRAKYRTWRYRGGFSENWKIGTKLLNTRGKSPFIMNQYIIFNILWLQFFRAPL